MFRSRTRSSWTSTGTRVIRWPTTAPPPRRYWPSAGARWTWWWWAPAPAALPPASAGDSRRSAPSARLHELTYLLFVELIGMKILNTKALRESKYASYASNKKTIPSIIYLLLQYITVHTYRYMSDIKNSEQ